MITRDDLAEIVRYHDAESEEHNDQPAFWAKREVEIAGLADVAMQRGLRVVMIEKGMNPNQTRPVGVRLNQTEKLAQVRYASVFMDGFAAGMAAAGRLSRT